MLNAMSPVPGWVTMRINGRLLSSRPMLKPFSSHLATILFYANYNVKKLKIRLGNRAHRIQHASIMLKRLVLHFYPIAKCTLMITGGNLFRNPSSLYRGGWPGDLCQGQSIQGEGLTSLAVRRPSSKLEQPATHCLPSGDRRSVLHPSNMASAAATQA